MRLDVGELLMPPQQYAPGASASREARACPAPVRVQWPGIQILCAPETRSLCQFRLVVFARGSATSMLAVHLFQED